MTQSGHQHSHSRPLSQCRFEPLRCPVPSLGGGNETARVHHAYWRRGGRVAVHGARAAGRADAAYRHPPGHNRGRCGISGLGRGVPAGAGAIRLDHRPQRADRHPLGRSQGRRHSQTRGRIGRARARCYLGPWRLDRGGAAAGDPHSANRVPDCLRSGRPGLRRKHGAAGRQRHWLHLIRLERQREMAGTA
jgi:hypothetical protein